MTLFPKRKLAKLELKDRKRARRNDDLRGLVDGFRTIFNWMTRTAERQEVSEGLAHVDFERDWVELNSNEPHPYHPIDRTHPDHTFGACDINDRK